MKRVHTAETYPLAGEQKPAPIPPVVKVEPPRETAEQARQRVAELNTILEAQPQDIRALQERNKWNRQLGQWREAAADLEVLADVSERRSGARMQVAYIAALGGDLECYRRSCRAMIDQFGDSDNLEDLERVCKAPLLIAGEFKIADLPLERFEKMIKPEEPDQGPTYWACTTRAYVASRAGQPAEALGWLAKRPIGEYAMHLYGYQQLIRAQALHQLGRDEEAREAFDSILKRFPKDIDAVYAVGLLAFQVKEYAVAEANMKRLLELGYRDANTVHFTLGQIAEEQKNWAGAIQWYDAIQRGEQALPARMRTANALSKQGKLPEARSYLRGVKAQDEPQRVQLLVAESQLLRDANQNREAFELLGQELQKTPDQPELLYDHALTAEKLERFDILESSLKRLIQIKPDHAHAYNALGYSYADRNLRLPEAKQLIEKALEISPTDFFIIDSLGWVLFRMGDLQGAARELRRAWEGRPDGEIGAHLGEVLWIIGEREEARRIWRESLKASPENDTLQKTLKRFVP